MTEQTPEEQIRILTSNLNREIAENNRLRRRKNALIIENCELHLRLIALSPIAGIRRVAARIKSQRAKKD